jgi:hypothetical protein
MTRAPGATGSTEKLSTVELPPISSVTRTVHVPDGSLLAIGMLKVHYPSAPLAVKREKSLTAPSDERTSKCSGTTPATSRPDV